MNEGRKEIRKLDEFGKEERKEWRERNKKWMMDDKINCCWKESARQNKFLEIDLNANNDLNTFTAQRCSQNF